MSSNEYHFHTDWYVEGGLEEVADVLSDAPGFARWWPAVYLDVHELEHGDEHRVGCLVSLYTKGLLPYTLRWHCRITEAHYPYGFSLDAWGDFVGRGVWRLEAQGPLVHVSYDWQVRADKSLLRHLSFLLRPLFAANHRWAMARGEESLRLELARRRAHTAEERAHIPPPPGPVWPIFRRPSPAS